MADNNYKYKEELDKVRSSKSWRITRPLRLISATVKRATGKTTSVLTTGIKVYSEPPPDQNAKLDSKSVDDIIHKSAVAEISMNKRAWEEAKEKWEEIVTKYRGSSPPSIFVRLSICLRQLGKLNDAQAIIKRASAVLSDYMPLYIENAEISMDSSDWPKAIHKWKKLLADFEDKCPADIYVKLSRAYRFSNRPGLAEKTITLGLKKFPDDERLLIESAEVAVSRSDLRQGIERWSLLTHQLTPKSTLEKWVKYKDGRMFISIASRLLELEKYKKQIIDYQHKNAKIPTSKKVAVFTVITGNYDHIKLPEKLEPEIDYVLFTDKPVDDTGIHKVRAIPFFQYDKVRTARYIKTHANILLKNYKAAIWLDASIMTIGDILPIVNDFIKSNEALGAVPHPERTSVFQEGKMCIKLQKDDVATIERQMVYYKSVGFECRELIETGILMFNTGHRGIADFLNQWWNQIDQFSRRDQLSVNYALVKTNIKWHPIMSDLCGIRNHPAFVLDSHNNGSKLLARLSKEVAHDQISPYNTKPFLGSKKAVIASQSKKRIDVVVCVHNALTDVKRCLVSVARNKSPNMNLIVVDDGSDQSTNNYLRRFVKDKAWATILRNDIAEGYSKAANKGLRHSEGDLVILLNSDTITTANWIEKISAAAFSSNQIGIVGPLSSAAGHQSIPKHSSTKNQTAINDLPPNVTIENMNSYCEKWSKTEL